MKGTIHTIIAKTKMFKRKGHDSVKSNSLIFLMPHEWREKTANEKIAWRLWHVKIVGPLNMKESEMKVVSILYA